MNKEIKRIIREIETRNKSVALKFCQTLAKLDIIIGEIPNWHMPKDEKDRIEKLAMYKQFKCSELAKRMFEAYGSDRINRIKKWRMIVS